ncbi:2,5-diketo-D-gluconic acid reductase [Suicoccus acidiformans]|uniref:2,5-diketo-D-gluconic acid reductase n=1 Tax=Suicoccus acidiformans TaxID=2036206 RepID=A0A347WNI9_9LACT|nr:aldo/keto reductase [Suicoccus acidiformans]AXY26646.1 2,5-diketo-D-gluconic acid reductase [Suicoccus acidiformans]
MENVRLSNGVEMPKVGFGVFRIEDLATCEQAVLDALAVGYRSIDTAQYYQNEEAVGRAIRKSPVAREDIFLATKIWESDFAEDKTEQAVYGSMRRLGVDYLDLVLLHHPYGDYYGAYRALEKLYREGLIRAIGISNFYLARYLDFVSHVDIVPHINQVENHVFYQQAELASLMETYATKMEAWGPLAQGAHNFFKHPIIAEIAEKHQKTNSQVGLRYLLQLDRIVIPKSVHRERIEENFNVFDFELDEADMASLRKLDTDTPNNMGYWEVNRVKRTLRI